LAAIESARSGLRRRPEILAQDFEVESLDADLKSGRAECREAMSFIETDCPFIFIQHGQPNGFNIQVSRKATRGL
jgi:hypothetical protein